jgi:hypothetical protein
VHRPVMPAAEQRQVRQHRGPALSPVVEMVALGNPNPAAWEAAAPVAMLERPPQGGWNGPGPRPDLHHTPSLVVPHTTDSRHARRRDVPAGTWAPSPRPVG